MFALDNIIDFSNETAETLYVNAGKIKKNYEMLSTDLAKISNPEKEEFIKIYIGMAGGHIRPVLTSTKQLSDFIDSNYMIANAISEKASKIFTGEADEQE